MFSLKREYFSVFSRFNVSPTNWFAISIYRYTSFDPRYFPVKNSLALEIVESQKEPNLAKRVYFPTIQIFLTCFFFVKMFGSQALPWRRLVATAIPYTFKNGSSTMLLCIFSIFSLVVSVHGSFVDRLQKIYGHL